MSVVLKHRTVTRVSHQTHFSEGRRKEIGREGEKNKGGREGRRGEILVNFFRMIITIIILYCFVF